MLKLAVSIWLDVRVKVQAQKNYASLTQELLWPYWILPHSASPYEFTPLNWFATLGSFLFFFIYSSIVFLTVTTSDTEVLAYLKKQVV